MILLVKLFHFFNKYQIQGVKHLDYFNLVSVIELMKNKAHLTKEGLVQHAAQIRKIKAGMNKGSLKRKASSSASDVLFHFYYLLIILIINLC